MSRIDTALAALTITCTAWARTHQVHDGPELDGGRKALPRG